MDNCIHKTVYLFVRRFKIMKNSYPVRMEQGVYAELQYLKEVYGKKSIGDVLEGLTNLARYIREGKVVKSQEFIEVANGLLETAMASIGGKVVWVAAKSDEELKLWLLDGQDEASLSEAAKKELEIALKMLRGRESK
jgi:hypothetical protein